jgi:NADPH:quinone reductase-like Zn-dependent oxidoreductase
LKAVRIHRHGGVEQLCCEEIPQPKLESSQDVIVKLKAAALNQIDLRVRRGDSSAPVSLPLILGADGAGVVVERGSDVRNVNVGQAVCLSPAIGCGSCDYCSSDRQSLCERLEVLGAQRDGTYAEYVRVTASNCFAAPAGLTFEEAAALPASFGTAWRMLFSDARLRPGEWILIRGIGGGVATAALRLALDHAARVIVTSRSDEKLAKAAALGAAHGINSMKCDFAAEVRRLTGKRGVDVVVDCIGGADWRSSLAALARGGRLVTCGAVAGSDPLTNLQRIFWNHLKIIGSGFASNREFAQLLNYFAVSDAKPVLDKVFPLQEAIEAQARLEAGKQFGKIILKIEN